MTTGVVLMSGGIDSATCCAKIAKYYDRVIPVFCGYGQQTEKIERAKATRQLKSLRDVYEETEIEGMLEIEYNRVFAPFAEGVADPDSKFKHLVEDDGRSSGYVPMRNLHLLATGAGIADNRDAQVVCIGAQGSDEATYPDCREDFLRAAHEAIYASLPDGERIDVKAPLINMSKTEVILEAEKHGVRFEHTYSCYEETDFYEPEPCGECPACLERAEAFEATDFTDPYEVEQ